MYTVFLVSIKEKCFLKYLKKIFLDSNFFMYVIQH
jgi:hypothetical protein